MSKDRFTDDTDDDDLKDDVVRQHLRGMFQSWYLDYASYTILDRAIPHIKDGLKPVQRRILHSMKTLDDGRFNKVANIVGNTMQYHPHGDASIYGAIVQLGQKDLLVETQGDRVDAHLRRPQAGTGDAPREIPTAALAGRKRYRRGTFVADTAP